MLVAWVTGMLAVIFPGGAAAQPAADAMESAALLKGALNALVEDQGRWAYTETRTGVGRDGKPLAESCVRFDPSAVYAEQRKPILVQGKPPTEKQLKEASERGEREGKRRFDERQRLAAASVTEESAANQTTEEIHLWVAGKKATPLVDQAKVVGENETSVTFELPMRAEGGGQELLNKFELTARVNKQSGQFERATIRQRETMRVKLIAKISDTLLTIEFSTPDPRYPSVPTTFISTGSVAVLFGKAKEARVEMVRAELKHVTPYDERFEVKIGPSRTIEF